MFKKLAYIVTIFLITITHVTSKTTLSLGFSAAKPIKILKLGGGVITDKNAQMGIAKKDVIDQIAQEISEYKGKLILINGAGSFGHPLAKQYNLKHGFNIMGAIETHNSVRKLNEIIVASLLKHGIPAISIDPMSSTVCQSGRIISMQVDNIKLLLDNGFVPVLFGDVVIDTDKKTCILSGDQIATYLAKKLDINVLGFGSIEDGVYDQNRHVIPQIDNRNFDNFKKQIGESKYTDVTGGMLQKIREILDTNYVTSYIFNATEKGNIYKFLHGEKIGTEIIS